MDTRKIQSLNVNLNRAALNNHSRPSPETALAELGPGLGGYIARAAAELGVEPLAFIKVYQSMPGSFWTLLRCRCVCGEEDDDV